MFSSIDSRFFYLLSKPGIDYETKIVFDTELIAQNEDQNEFFNFDFSYFRKRPLLLILEFSDFSLYIVFITIFYCIFQDIN